jgi:hypothetical protein
MAAEGCNVVIVSRSADGLAALKSAIGQNFNVRVDTVAADLSDSANVAGWLRPRRAAHKAWDMKVIGYVNMCSTFYALIEGAANRCHNQRRRQIRTTQNPSAAWRGTPGLPPSSAAVDFMASEHSNDTSRTSLGGPHGQRLSEMRTTCHI